MLQTNITKHLKHFWHRHGTMNNIVMVVALVIAASWVWGSVTTMQRNYTLQKEVDDRKRQLELTKLEVATLEYQQNYYRSDEYKELAARERLGLALPDEKVLILPPNSEAAKQEPKAPVATANDTSGASNFEQWMNFLFGNNSARLKN